MTAERMQQLLDFNWKADVIFHEAGIPPIHTPIATLQALPDDIKKVECPALPCPAGCARSDAKDTVRTVGANLVFNCAFAAAAQLATERGDGQHQGQGQAEAKSEEGKDEPSDKAVETVLRLNDAAGRHGVGVRLAQRCTGLVECPC